jgi:hypothetical protein
MKRSYEEKLEFKHINLENEYVMNQLERSVRGIQNDRKGM